MFISVGFFLLIISNLSLWTMSALSLLFIQGFFFCLKLNQDKTEWLIFNGDAISRNVTLTVGEHNIKQSAHIRSLGVKLDPEITIEPQIADVCKSAYYHLRRINKIRRYLTEDSTKTLVHSLVTGRLDYCNSIY